MFDMFKKICNELDYFDKLNEKHHFHSLELCYRKNISLLYENTETEEWIKQNILDCDFIYQRNIKDEKRRIFFILDKNNKIIKPLFLDLNHLIIPMKKYKNTFLNCFICRRTLKNCQEKLKEPN